MNNTILTTSSKNETGKSIIALKTGIGLSEKNKKTIVIDLSSGIKSIANYADIEEQIIYDIQDVLEETCSIEQAIIETNNNLHILPASRLKEKLNKTDEKQFSKLISRLKILYDYIIIDAPVIFNQNFINTDLIDYVIIVDDSNISSKRNIYKIYNFFKRNIKKNIFVIINKYINRDINNGIAFSEKDIKKMLPIKILGCINYDEAFLDLESDFFFEYKIKEFDNIINKLISKLISKD